MLNLSRCLVVSCRHVGSPVWPSLQQVTSRGIAASSCLQQPSRDIEQITQEHSDGKLGDRLTKKPSTNSNLVTDICYPPIPVDMWEKAENMIAFDVLHDSFCWTSVNKELQVEDWQQSIIFDENKPKRNRFECMERICECLESIPPADIYVMESRKRKITNLKMAPYMNNLIQIESILYTLLNRNYPETGQHRVYTLKTPSISKLFHLNVGGERVSAIALVEEILGKSYKSSQEEHSWQVPYRLVKQFRSAERYQQESLSTSFLLAMAFHSLVVNKSPLLPDSEFKRDAKK